jgi:NAD(P)-dependent dehydrogenase (short-subunit alcohol dehydrogenase family)
MNRFSGKTALVTGGSSGIGLATARLLLAEGGRVAVTGRDPKTLEAARKELGPHALVIRSDASNLKDLTALAGEVEKVLGGLDLAFLNAGIARFTPYDQVTEEEWDSVLDTNLRGVFFAIQRLSKLVRPGGSFVLNTSVAQTRAFPTTAAYAATKAGLRALARTLSAELLPRGVRVNAVCPGPITTPIFGKLGLPQEAADAFTKQLAETNPMRRFGTPDEVAHAVLFLAVEATYTVGCELPVDGGVSQL